MASNLIIPNSLPIPKHPKKRVASSKQVVFQVLCTILSVADLRGSLLILLTRLDL